MNRAPQMTFFRAIPIRHKLTIISMLASGTALLLACLTFLSFEYRLFKQGMVTDLTTTARVIGDNSAAALNFDYPASAELTLHSLSAKPHIIGAAVYDKGGKVFATYRQTTTAAGRSFSPGPVQPDGSQFSEGALDVFQQITLNGEVIGAVTVRSSLEEMRERFRQYVLIAAAVMLAAAVAAFLLATRLQRVIVEPVSHLAAIARAVGRRKDYSVRATKTTHDELGQLIDGFNEMLNQIQAREGTLQERASELTQKNLELVRAMQAKDVFLANMSHELRTPLNAIIGFTGTLLMKLPGTLNSRQEEQLTIVIKTSAQHLLSLINDLLDLAKIESGKVELALEPVSCKEVVESSVTTLRVLAEQKGVALAVQLPRQDVVVKTDRRSLRQILLNFCNNAIKFTDVGSVTVAVERKEADGRQAVEISVTDTGIGIRPDYRDKMFQAFAQMESTDREGTGLGLHLSQKLAHLIGGRIDFSSEYGKGSRFWLTLPVE
jgi:signal transduction histidine kinase